MVKFFGELPAVNGIGFRVEQGEIFGLIGPNGSGKTTIFNLINHFITLDAGEIFFYGKDLHGLAPQRINKLGIARTFQTPQISFSMSVLDQVTAAAFCRTNRMKQARESARECLAFCGLESRGEYPAAGLPVGLRKRLELARALATRPQLMLLDETFSGLNPSEINQALDLIKKINSQGITLIIIEHIMKVIMAISDRILVINHGRVITEGTPETVSQTPQVIEAYLGKKDRAGIDSVVNAGGRG
ncbi:MAG: ABC transporter ATP-binding protein [Thermodesulfobacteriota bacterium]